MPSDKDASEPSQVGFDAPSGASGDGAVFSAEFDASAEIQTLIDNSTSKAMTKTIMSAMGVMSDSLSQTFAQTWIQAQRSVQLTTTQALPLTTPVHPHYGHKTLAKVKHFSILQMGSFTPVTDGAINVPLRKRATSREKSARLWKRAKAQLVRSQQY
ncbi:Hypothetical predicted protein [Pelobates cultripes]|uniref:Uncharacterized protein n=1 Tax=Pelobates cultripes TaxID=61616 RepID=A0AAD1RWX0_PELCU|nr:Hypothetical predicted protein [Pelobates cultripes]